MITKDNTISYDGIVSSKIDAIDYFTRKTKPSNLHDSLSAKSAKHLLSLHFMNDEFDKIYIIFNEVLADTERLTLWWRIGGENYESISTLFSRKDIQISREGVRRAEAKAYRIIDVWEKEYDKFK